MPGALRLVIRFRSFGQTYDAAAVAVTIALGGFGGLIATQIGAPLPWLAGALVVIAAASLAGVRIVGQPLQFPIDIRKYFIPIVGVSIGGAFSWELLDAATRWWPTLLVLGAFVPLAHLAGFLIYRRLGKLDVVTAYFAAMPGGFVEALAIGEQQGADPSRLALLQFSRLIFCTLSVPLIFMVVEGHAVGSAAGVSMSRDAGGGLDLLDAVVLIGAGALGLFGGQAIGLPAAIVTGPLILSGAAHLGGLTSAVPPDWMVSVTQLVVGVSLGVRFAGLTARTAFDGMALAFLNVMGLLAIGAAVGALLAGSVSQSIEAVVLAFAPGGVVEMSLVAVSLDISVVYVTTHHVLRILLTVFFAQLGLKTLLPSAKARAAQSDPGPGSP